MTVKYPVTVLYNRAQNAACTFVISAQQANISIWAVRGAGEHPLEQQYIKTHQDSTKPSPSQCCFNTKRITMHLLLQSNTYSNSSPSSPLTTTYTYMQHRKSFALHKIDNRSALHTNYHIQPRIPSILLHHHETILQPSHSMPSKQSLLMSQTKSPAFPMCPVSIHPCINYVLYNTTSSLQTLIH